MFTILSMHTDTHPVQLYCSSHPTLTVIDRYLQSHWKFRHKTYGSPALLSCPPSHESFVAEVEVAGAVRSLSEQQEEEHTLSRTQTGQPSCTLTVNPL